MSDYHESILFSLIIGECNIIDPAITTIISSDGHTLRIKDISEKDLAILTFPTNTDDNNNKLTLIDASVTLESNPTKTVVIPGLREQMIYAFNNSNSRGFRKLDNIHRPFAEIPAGSLSPYKPSLTTPELTDTLAGITTFTQPTLGKKKLYELVLTNACPPCPSGQVCLADGRCGAKT